MKKMQKSLKKYHFLFEDMVYNKRKQEISRPAKSPEPGTEKRGRQMRYKLNFLTLWAVNGRL